MIIKITLFALLMGISIASCKKEEPAVDRDVPKWLRGEWGLKPPHVFGSGFEVVDIIASKAKIIVHQENGTESVIYESSKGNEIIKTDNSFTVLYSGNEKVIYERVSDIELIFNGLADSNKPFLKK